VRNETKKSGGVTPPFEQKKDKKTCLFCVVFCVVRRYSYCVVGLFVFLRVNDHEKFRVSLDRHYHGRCLWD
jgi:hypothetical protein